MVKNKPTKRQILLNMLWSIESVNKARDICCGGRRMTRQEFAKKYNCRDKKVFLCKIY